ncbi:hypothetical protein [Nocardia transvalensis]|uniref:hypothetical protein n=1 Tax=Nocardia transvalensis TaxID=37333 RepID=UPI0018942722|nr:hypothetical protein [Nocardia transvalensis]MBF6330264.1 hypothetical protein [Nocardia transvalensis]
MPEDNDTFTSSDTTETTDPVQTDTEQTDMFPRAYVEKLRDENAKYRQRAGRADEYAHRLHAELVRATGRLTDPTDLPFDPDHLTDPQTLTTAIDALLARKPHLAARTPVGDIGQGATSSAAAVDLAGLLRARAR